MKTKGDIVKNWLPRYTGEKLENFGKYILLTNFSNYLGMFAEWNKVEIVGADRPMQCATAGNISIINFGMGSPGAATVMDLLTAGYTPAQVIEQYDHLTLEDIHACLAYATDVIRSERAYAVKKLIEES